MYELFDKPSISSFTDILNYANYVMGYHFGDLTLLSLFIISYISLVRYGSDKAFVTASFITAISSYMLLMLDLVGTHIPVITTVMLLAAIFMLKK